ncbi:MAG: hypothetical protein H7X84_09175 [Verrucomicrobia bacterium]|nr:hypothetical protein [Prolixibacteraceae bacterium]
MHPWWPLSVHPHLLFEALAYIVAFRVFTHDRARRDVVKAMIMLMDDRQFEMVKNQRFILNAGNMSYEEFFNKIADGLNKPRPKNFASDIKLNIAWRMALTASFFTGKRPLITRDAVSGSNRKHQYSGDKIIRTTGFSYRSLDSSIADIAEIFLKDVVLPGRK